MDMKSPYYDPEFAPNMHFFKVPFPEVDTVRFAIPAGSLFNVDKFIQKEFSKKIANFQKMVDDEGRPYLDEKGNEIIVEYLKSGGITEDEITVSVPQISDKLASEYGSSSRAYRYIAKNVVTVYTDKDFDAIDIFQDLFPR